MFYAEIAGINREKLIGRKTVQFSKLPADRNVRYVWQQHAVRETNEFFFGHAFASKGIQHFLADTCNAGSVFVCAYRATTKYE